MNGPSRFEITPEQVARNANGVAGCRAAIGALLAARAQPEPDAPLTASEEIHQRALDRACSEKRAQRLHGVESVGTLISRIPGPRR